VANSVAVDGAHVGGDLAILPAFDVSANEPYSGTGISRMECQRDRQP